MYIYGLFLGSNNIGNEGKEALIESLRSNQLAIRHDIGINILYNLKLGGNNNDSRNELNSCIIQ